MWYIWDGERLISRVRFLEMDHPEGGNCPTPLGVRPPACSTARAHGLIGPMGPMGSYGLIWTLMDKIVCE